MGIQTRLKAAKHNRVRRKSRPHLDKNTFSRLSIESIKEQCQSQTGAVNEYRASILDFQG